MIEYRVGYYTEQNKYVAQRRASNFFSPGTWRSIGRWTDTKEEAEAVIDLAKKVEASGVTVIA